MTTVRLQAQLVASIMLFGLPGCGSSASVVRPPTAAEVADFATKAHISLPATAHAVAYSEERGMDDGLWLQFKMPASELQAFLDSSPFAGANWRINEPYCLSHFDRFIREPPTRYRGAQEELSNARFVNIAIDEADEEFITVYLMWHET